MERSLSNEWITSSEAVALLESKWGTGGAKRLIVDRCVQGVLNARAGSRVQMIGFSPGKNSGPVYLTSDFWVGCVARGGVVDWETGDLSLDGNGGATRYSDIRFQKSMIASLAGSPGDGQLPSDAAGTAKGGRRANRHGDAIAAVTLDLLDAGTDVINTSTGDAVGAQLKAEYAKLGKAPPDDRNLRDYGEGILRVLRQRYGL